MPQNRERVFCISILKTNDDPNPSFFFPKPFPLEKRLKDVIETDVDGTPKKLNEKYYLSDKALEYFDKQTPTGQIGRLNSSQDGVVSLQNGVSPTHTSGHGNCPKIIE